MIRVFFCSISGRLSSETIPTCSYGFSSNSQISYVDLKEGMLDNSYSEEEEEEEKEMITKMKMMKMTLIVIYR